MGEKHFKQLEEEKEKGIKEVRETKEMLVELMGKELSKKEAEFQKAVGEEQEKLAQLQQQLRAFRRSLCRTCRGLPLPR